ncbi:MAG: hypothetical protein WCU00_14480 [Candidatus Latescibacterota bacterium]
MTARLILENGVVVCGEEIIHDGSVVIQEGKIAGIYLSRELNIKKSNRVVDCSDSFICPGFIDIHNQDGVGFSVMDGTWDSIKGLAQVHAHMVLPVFFLHLSSKLRDSESFSRNCQVWSEKKLEGQLFLVWRIGKGGLHPDMTPISLFLTEPIRLHALLWAVT